MPSVDDIYDGKVLSQAFDFDGLENQMEGKFRPVTLSRNNCKTSFEIVTLQMLILRKDFQQANCKKNGHENNIEVNVIGCAISESPMVSP
jgi:pantoate--beta-alanine ligase